MEIELAISAILFIAVLINCAALGVLIGLFMSAVDNDLNQNVYQESQRRNES